MAKSKPTEQDSTEKFSMFGSAEDLAAILGITSRHVNRLLAAGIIVKEKEGDFYLPQAIRDYWMHKETGESETEMYRRVLQEIDAQKQRIKAARKREKLEKHKKWNGENMGDVETLARLLEFDVMGADGQPRAARPRQHSEDGQHG